MFCSRMWRCLPGKHLVITFTLMNTLLMLLYVKMAQIYKLEVTIATGEAVDARHDSTFRVYRDVAAFNDGVPLNESLIGLVELNTADFVYIHEPRLDCSQEDLFLIYVYSAPENHQRRTLVRQTWGNLTHYAGYRQFQFRLFFVLGWRRDDELRNQIQLESNVYSDLLVADFIDSYFNLTLKGLSALRWIRSSCPLKNIKYVFKTDDHIFVNFYALLNRIEATSEKFKWHFLCNLNRNKPLSRTGKWSLGTDLYADDVYPTYCGGEGYVMTRTALRLLLGSCLAAPLHSAEDFFFTNHCIRRLLPEVQIKYQSIARKHRAVTLDEVHVILAERGIEGIADLTLVHPLPVEHWIDVDKIVERKLRHVRYRPATKVNDTNVGIDQG